MTGRWAGSIGWVGGGDRAEAEADWCRCVCGAEAGIGAWGGSVRGCRGVVEQVEEELLLLLVGGGSGVDRAGDEKAWGRGCDEGQGGGGGQAELRVKG